LVGTLGGTGVSVGAEVGVEVGTAEGPDGSFFFLQAVMVDAIAMAMKRDKTSLFTIRPLMVGFQAGAF
jgi:hypothetical protein